MTDVARLSDQQIATPNTQFAAPGPHAHRADIQGLRAVAVLLVVANHLVGWPAGGFIGVDVFFVISGFLITGSLLTPATRSAPRALMEFYGRRARRILPAAALTLVSTVLMARILFSEERADRVLTDALWSAAFAANWHFGQVGTDYFDATLPDSPLQHFWTLAVEEQFYLVWPLLVISAITLTLARSRGRAHVSIFVLSAILVVGGFAWSWHDTLTEPVTAYFSTTSRVWELAIGALLATVTGACRTIPHRVRELMVLAGLVTIAISAVGLSESGLVPAPGAAPAVIATALFLAAGTGSRRTLAAHRMVTIKPMRHVGNMSYSLYLWHWPVIVFVDASGIDNSWLRVPAVVGFTVLLAELSHRFIEQPFLRSAANRSDSALRRRRAAVLVTAAVTLAAMAMTALPKLSGQAPPAAESRTSLDAADQTAPAPLSQTLGDQLLDALGRAEFPQLNPSIEAPSDGVPPELEAPAGCLDPDDPTDSSLCTYRPDSGGERLAVIIGDSVALSWLPGIRAALAPEGFAVHAITFSNCPPALVRIDLDPATASACTKGLDAALDQIDDLSPDLVIGSALPGSIGLVRPAADGGDVQAAYVAGLADVGERVRRSGAGYVLLGPPPGGPSPLTCGGAFNTPADCVTSSRGEFEATLYAFAQAAQGRFGFVTTQYWFCVDVTCPIFAGGILIRWDVSHITEQYSEYLAPLLRENLAPYTS